MKKDVSILSSDEDFLPFCLIQARDFLKKKGGIADRYAQVDKLQRHVMM